MYKFTEIFESFEEKVQLEIGDFFTILDEEKFVDLLLKSECYFIPNGFVKNKPEIEKLVFSKIDVINVNYLLDMFKRMLRLKDENLQTFDEFIFCIRLQRIIEERKETKLLFDRDNETEFTTIINFICKRYRLHQRNKNEYSVFHHEPNKQYYSSEIRARLMSADIEGIYQNSADGENLGELIYNKIFENDNN